MWLVDTEEADRARHLVGSPGGLPLRPDVVPHLECSHVVVVVGHRRGGHHADGHRRRGTRHHGDGRRVLGDAVAAREALDDHDHHQDDDDHGTNYRMTAGRKNLNISENWPCPKNAYSCL